MAGYDHGAAAGARSVSSTAIPTSRRLNAGRTVLRLLSTLGSALDFSGLVRRQVTEGLFPEHQFLDSVIAFHGSVFLFLWTPTALRKPVAFVQQGCCLSLTCKRPLPPCPSSMRRPQISGTASHACSGSPSHSYSGRPVHAFRGSGMYRCNSTSEPSTRRFRL